MADFFKGLSGGFQSGLQLSQAMRDREERDRLREIQDAAFTESQGYTAAQGRQLEGLANSGGYDIVPQYASPAEGQTQGLFTGYQAVSKAGLQDQASGDMPAAPQTYAPQRVTDFLGQRYEGGLAPERMETIRTRAMANAVADPRLRQQMLMSVTGEERAQAAEGRAQADAAYQAQRRPLDLENLQGQIASQAQQRNLADLQLKAAGRTETELQNASNFATFAAERPDATAAELKDAAFKQFKFTPKQWQDTVTTRLGIENAEMDSFKNNVKKKLQGKNLTQLGSLYNSDPDFDDKTDLAIVPGKGGAVTLNFIDKTTKAITGTQTFKNEALATEYLNKQATEPETMGSWMVNLRKAESTIEAQGAATVASNAAANLSNVRAGGLKRDAATQTKLDKIEQEFEALTPDEKVGAKGRALITSYNMASAGPGRQLSLGAAVKPEFTPKDYASTVKSFTDAGFSPTDALIKADQLYGRGPKTGDENAALQEANKKKGLGTATAPIEVRPGESRMTAPGAVVRGPLEDFLRESRRGMFGGVEYFYTDPLTKKRCTTEQYNQLQNQ
jgi:hypothetical protein